MFFALLLVIVLAAFAAFAWRRFDDALILLCALTPTYLVRFSIGPIPTTLLEGFVLVVIGIFSIQNAKHLCSSPLQLPHKWGRVSGLSISSTLIAIAAMISTIIAPDHTSALGILKAYYIEPFVIGAIMMKRFDRAQFEKAFMAFCASSLVVSLFAIVQILFHVGIPEAWTVEGRATSFFPYPNAVGLFLAPMVSMLLVLFVGRWSLGVGQHRSDNARRTTTFVFSIVLFLVAILLSKTEAALVAIPVAVILTLMIAPIATKTKVNITGASLVIGLLLFGAIPSIADKLTLHDTSGLVRRSQWSETLNMLADHAYLGVGLNAYPTALVPYHDATLYEIFQYPHNIILNIWSELGLLGLVGFTGLFIVATRFAWQNKKDPWVLACFAALLTMGIHGLVDVPFFKNDLAILTVFFFVGMMSREGVDSRV